MGNEYNRFNHQYHQRSTFLPMLCSRPSIKDARLPTNPLKVEDPLSPRISCMGQVKRTSKVNGFPTSHHRLTFTSSSSSPTNHHQNYSKLKKLFSSKNLTSTISTVSTTTSTVSTTTRCKRQVIVNAASGPRIHGHKTHSYKIHHNNEDHQDHCVADINLVDLDPPLPVIKRVQAQSQAQDEEVKSLWKRRSGGAALEGLQLKPIHLPRHQNQPTTV